mgnify:CR=1 FL=1
MPNVKKMLESWAKDTTIEHEDYNKCGTCLKEHIKSQVANEFLQAGKLSAENLTEMLDEVDKRFRETELYIRVRKMLDEGKNMEQISMELEQEGIDI